MHNCFNKKRCLVIVSVALLTINIYAINKNNHTENFFYLLYNYEFQSADSVLKIIENNCDDKKLVALLKVTYSWQRLMSGYDDKKSIENCLELTQNTISNQLASYKNNNSCNYYLILLYGYKARLSNMLGNKVSGIKAFFDGIKYLEQLDTCSAENTDIYKLTGGIYYCLIGYAYKSYPYLFLFNDYSKYANIENGYNLLKQGANSGLYFIQIECLYFLVKLNTELEKNNEQSILYINKLLDKAPGNLLFHYYKVQLLKDMGKTQQVTDGKLSIKTIMNNNPQLDSQQKKHYLEISKYL